MIELSETADNIMLDALSGLLDGGHIELSSDERVIAVLQLSSQATQAAVNGQLEFNEIAEEDAALATGNVIVARILAVDGSEVFRCDVGDENSDAVVKLITTKIYRGQAVRLKSFRLMMP